MYENYDESVAKLQMKFIDDFRKCQTYFGNVLRNKTVTVIERARQI